MEFMWGGSSLSGSVTNHQPRLPNETELFFEGNEIFFSVEVNKYTIDKLIKTTYQVIWRHITKETGYDSITNHPLRIVFHIDSPGGSVPSLLKFVDFCNVIKKKHDVTVVTVCTGTIASAATLMCLMGDNRIMTRNATYMIHELSAMNWGNYTTMKSYIDYLQTQHNRLIDLYVQKSKLTKDQVESLLQKTSWLTPEQCLEYGLIDEIVQ